MRQKVDCIDAFCHQNKQVLPTVITERRGITDDKHREDRYY